MLKMDTPVSAIPKIGPKYKKLLENLEIFKIEDLLYHFPFRYNDFGQIKKIDSLIERDMVTIQGVMGPVQNIFTKYRKRITKAKVVDYTGEMEIIWFNQHYIKNTLKTGQTYNISGKVGSFNNKPCFISPEVELASNNTVNTGRLVPIYPETAGVSSKWIRNKTNFLLNSNLELEEFLPEPLLKAKNLKNLVQNLNQIHFPTSIEEAENAKERFQFEELFIELLNVEKRRQEWNKTLESIRFLPFEKELAVMIGKLPFELTKCQKIAFEEISRDTSNKHPMNRLLEGDVGTGKTLVALLSAYLSHLNGYKTLYMAPTEILANQHFETFKDILKNYDIKIELATGSSKPKEEDWNILIGTHAILYKGEPYKDVGLIIIDEQHRFGVEQRGKILEMSKDKEFPHLLTMTATPIPRTLALTLYGDLSISALKTYPKKHREVTTKVVPEQNRDQAYEWIRNKGEQTFIVCPLIEESESLLFENVKAAEKEFEKLETGVFKDIPMGLLHGRMKSKEKDEIVKEFKKGNIKILVSTPVIEVGIDVPDATVIVIESAERYGLASLHQLRGRVGRGLKEGFCFVFMTNNSRNAYSRLKNLEKIQNGLELAEIDMKIRGRGDLFGAMQHGFKKFKIADLNNLEMLEDAKIEAQKYYSIIDNYPLLESKLTERKGKYITSN